MGHPADRAAHAEGEGTLTQTSAGTSSQSVGGKTDRVHVCCSRQALEWNLCPETPISWLKLYAQVEAQKDEENFLVPQFCPETYIKITQVRAPFNTPCST